MDTNQLKEQVREDFELTIGITSISETAEEHKKRVEKFIDSLIDKVVQMTEERVVLSIKNLDNETIPRQEVLVCTHTDSMDSMCSECILELNDDIYRKGYNCAVLKIQEKLKESLITNKSDINK